jgi:hypothetical protein
MPVTSDQQSGSYGRGSHTTPMPWPRSDVSQARSPRRVDADGSRAYFAKAGDTDTPY